MGRKQVHQLSLPRSINFLEDQWFPLSTNDYLAAPIFLQFGLYFSLPDDEERDPVLRLLMISLEETLSQCRFLGGTIQKNEYGDYSIVVRTEDTVPFTIHWIDEPENDAYVPSYADLEKSSFASTKTGDITQFWLEEIASGTASSSPDNNPLLLGIQVNLLPGGMVLVVHYHHWAMDFTGFASFIHQWAENSRALATEKPLPRLNPICLHRSLLDRHLEITEDAQIDAAPIPPAHPGYLPVSLLLFHLTRSKAQKLKNLATPEMGPRISTYDAFTSLWWRLLSKHRVKTYHVDVQSPAVFFEVISIRNRVTPQLPERFMPNAVLLAGSESQPEQLTFKEVIEDAPLSKLAASIRNITDSVDSTYVYNALDAVAPVRQKDRVFYHLKSYPPMTFKTTDWRSPNICTADFGFGRPRAFRHLFGKSSSPTNIYMYPPRRDIASEEEIFEFAVPVETVAVERFLEDADVKEWFDFRGVEFQS